MARTVVVVGVGPGLGESVARRFADGGDDVVLVARSEEYLRELAARIERSTPGRATVAPADVADPSAVDEAFATVRSTFGPVDVLVDCVYSTETESGGLLEVDAEAFRGAWAVETAGAFHCASEAARDMVETGGGTVIFTNSGASRNPDGGGVARTSARFGLRGLARSMTADLGPRGIHVVHAVVEGWIDKPALREAYPDRPDERWLDPDRIADTYWHLAGQDPSAWTFEVEFHTPSDAPGA